MSVEMGMPRAVVCAQCAISMRLERIEPHARRDRVWIEVHRCRQCQLVEIITRTETLQLARGFAKSNIGIAPLRSAARRDEIA